MSDIGAGLLTTALQDLLLREKVVDELLPRHAFTKAPAAAAPAAMDVEGAAAPAAPPPPSSALTYTTGGGRWLITRRELMEETRSFRTFAALEVWDDLKRSTCELHETGFDPA